ncbi:5-formyltetrahydrofolate cyclo-ligase [bacterium B13(2017)]|nr:5-formyltetrahydrofolate cyclo-ligase [bacterium B13(2017)]
MQNIEKKLIRNNIEDKVKSISENERKIYSEIIQVKALNLISYYSYLSETKDQLISVYVSTKNEVITYHIINEILKKCNVWIPKCNGNLLEFYSISSIEDLELGKFGILEPRSSLTKLKELNDLDLIIVPGIAFDINCNRLGRGKGFYDRCLSQLKKDVVRVGLAYDNQVLDNLPHNEYDQPVDYVITPSQVFSLNEKMPLPPSLFLERRNIS